MENNMKQFDLQEYLANPKRKVVTRDGRPVRIIYTDLDTDGGPIVAIVTMANKIKQVLQYYENGRYYLSSDSRSDDDLFFAPTKHTDYINLYHNEFGYFLGNREFETEEEAKKVGASVGTGTRTRVGDNSYITTIKVEWEESLL